MRWATVLLSLLLVGAVAGCSADSAATDTTASVDAGLASAEEVTAFLDQWVIDWNNANTEDLFGVFLPDAVFVMTTGKELVGDEYGETMKFLPLIHSMERTSEAVDLGDGSYSFNVEFPSDRSRNKRVLAITMEGGKLIKMVETRGS